MHGDNCSKRNNLDSKSQRGSIHKYPFQNKCREMQSSLKKFKCTLNPIANWERLKSNCWWINIATAISPWQHGKNAKLHDHAWGSFWYPLSPLVFPPCDLYFRWWQEAKKLPAPHSRQFQDDQRPTRCWHVCSWISKKKPNWDASQWMWVWLLVCCLLLWIEYGEWTIDMIKRPPTPYLLAQLMTCDQQWPTCIDSRCPGGSWLPHSNPIAEERSWS